MSFQPASSGSVIAFLAIVGSVIAAFLHGVVLSARHDRVSPSSRLLPAGLGLVIWLALIGGVVASGALASVSPGNPFPLLLFFGAVNGVSVITALSPCGRWFSTGVPLSLLVAFQAFRLPLELVLHAWAVQGTIPMTMTWSGSNWDIVSGSVALIAAPFVGRHRAIAWAVNLIGLVLLLNVLRVAMLSSPVSFGWKVEPPLLLALHLPYALIAPVCVGGALFGHVVLTRALLRRT